MALDVSPALGLTVDSAGVIKGTSALDKLTGAAAKAEKAAGDMGGASKRAGADAEKMSRDVDRASDSMHRMAGVAGTLVGRLVAMATAALSVGAYVKMADAWSDMRSVVGAAIGDMDAAGDMMERLVQIADASYSPLSQTVEIYSQNVRVLREMGRSADDAANFTESLNHMLVLTATKGQQAASVQMALSKAMAIGKLQAEGLESVLANGAEVSEALARELGVTTNELRKLASEGKITGDVIANALIKSLDDVRERAGEMPSTIGDGFQRIANQTTYLVGAFDQWAGISGAVAERLGSVAEWIGKLAQSDFQKWADAAAQGATVLGAALLGLAATRIPAVVASVRSMNIAYAAGIAAGRTLTAVTLALSGALKALGGPIGILIGAATAVGVYMLTARDRTEDYARAALMAKDPSGELADQLERIEKGGFAAAEAMQAISKATLMQRAQELTREVESAQSAIAKANNAISTAFLGMRDMAVDSAIAWTGYLSSLEESFLAGTLSADDYRARLDALAEAYPVLTSRIVELQTEIDNVATTSDRLSNVNAQIEGYTEAAAAAATTSAALSGEVQTLIDKYDQQTRLMQLETRYGKESLQVLAERVRQERAALDVKLDSIGATERERALVQQALAAHQQATHAATVWGQAVDGVRTRLEEAKRALEALRDAEPGGGWLDTAISKAATLASNLWDAAEGMFASGGLESSARPARRPIDRLPGDPSTIPGAGGRTGGGGGRSGPSERQTSLEALIEGLRTERETLEVWHAEKLGLIAQYSDAELAAIGGRNEAKLRLEEEYQERLSGIVSSESDFRMAETASMFEAMSGIAEVGGRKMLKVQATLSAASTMIAAYETAMKAAAEAKTIPGRIAAYAKFLALGLGAVAKIKAAGSGSGGGGGSASAGSTTTPEAPPCQPVTVSLQGVEPGSLYAGQQIIDLTTAVQKELGKRGVIFQFV